MSYNLKYAFNAANDLRTRIFINSVDKAEKVYHQGLSMETIVLVMMDDESGLI